MATYEATKYDFDGAAITGIQGLSTGTIIPWSTGTAPSGYLPCDGAAVSRSTYSALFAIIGTTYGAGDGSSTFNIPDLQDKCCVSKSNNKALASTGGANTVTKTGNIGGSTANATLSTAQLAQHSHPQSGTGSAMILSSGSIQFRTNPGASGSSGSDGGHSHNMSATFSGNATSVVQPYLTVLYIIKT